MFQQLRFKDSRNKGAILTPKVEKNLMLISKASMKEKGKFQQKLLAKKHYRLCVSPRPIYSTKNHQEPFEETHTRTFFFLKFLSLLRKTVHSGQFLMTGKGHPRALLSLEISRHKHSFSSLLTNSIVELMGHDQKTFTLNRQGP